MKNTPQLQSYFKSLIALVTSMRVRPESRPNVAMKLTTLFMAVSAAASLTLSSQAQISVTTAPGVPQDFNALPAVTEWSTRSIAGGSGDITTVAAMDADIIATIDATTVNNALPTASNFPVTQNALARWNDNTSGSFPSGGLLQTRPTGVRYAILMATLRNDSGNTLANLDVAYDGRQYNNIPVNESVPGHRVYFSLSGAPGSWTAVPGLSVFNNNSTSLALKATLPLRAGWPNASSLYLIFVDDNGPGGTGDPQEGGYSIDNVSFTGKGPVLLPNALNIGRNKVGSVTDNGFGSFTVVGGGNDVWDQTDEFTFAYTEVTGDFDVQVRIDDFTPNARWSKAGLMARESLSEYGRMVFPLITPADVPTTSGGNGGNYTAMGYRTGLDNNGGASGGNHEDRDGANTIGANNLPNGWLRLARIGNVVFSSNSLDGVAWQLVSSQDTATWGGGALPATLNLGLAASRHSGGPTATAQFRNLQFNYGLLFDVRRATSRGNPNGILVEYSKPVGSGAYSAASYTVDGGITVTEVLDGPTATQVRLVTSTMTEGTTYNVIVLGVTAADSTPLGVGTASFVHGAGYEANAIVLQHNKTSDSGYYRFSDAVAKGLGTLIHNGSGGVYPAYQVNGLFEDIVPDNGNNERYSTRISGVLNITVSGAYNFACSSDDQGFLYLSSDEQAANKVLIANEPAWNGSRSYTTQDRRGASQNRAGPIPLVAGQKYYIEYTYTEGGGGNNGSATWQPPGAPAIVAGQSPIPASAFMPSRSFNGNTFSTLGPVLVTQNPSPLTVPALTPATFTVKVDGTPNYTFQWKRNGVNIPGANGSSYTIPATQLADDGVLFSVTVANQFSSATSSGALLTVLNPTPPHLVSAQVDTTFSKVTVRFDNRLQISSANTPGNYSIPGTVVNSATRDASGRNVALVIAPPLAEGTTYTLTVSGVYDETGTALQDPNPASVTFTTLVFTPGYILKEFYNQFSGANVDPFITAYRAGSIAPFRTCLTNLYEINHADILDNYGGHMAGYYTADQTGPHVFFIASDDPGRLFLSTDENPASAVLVAREPVWSGRRTWTGEAGGGGRVGNPSPSGGAQANTTGPRMMTAGQRYFIESFFTEGGGGDNMAVAVQKPGDAGPPANGSSPITAANLGMYFDPAGTAVAITGQPVNQTVDENGFATFSVVATGSSPLCGGAFGVRWLKNGVPIPGAIGQSFTFGPASLADNGAVFSAQASVPGRNLTSDPATLTVNVDTNPPVVALAVGSATFDSITLIFNELVTPSTATDLFSYTVTGPMGSLNITAASLGADGRTVILLTDPQTEDAIYTIDYSLVTDIKGNLASADANNPATVQMHSFISGCSGVVFDIYRQVGGGTDINLLVNHPTFPNSPDETRLLSTFDTGADFAENYGGRVRGLFIPPVSGAWNLFVTADDGSRLFFNANGPSAAGKVLISEESPGCCTAFAGRRTGPFNLIAGRGYYLEGIYKEAGGGDYIRVAARLASDNTTALAPMPPAWAGVPAAPPGVGGALTISQQPASLCITQNQRATFTVNAANENGLPLCYQWRKNAMDIPGANGPTYSYTPVPLSDDGSGFQVLVSVIGSRALSAFATLKVLPDLIRPSCVEARGSVSLSNVVVRFSEFMDPTSAANNFNYVVDGGAFGVSSVVLNPDGMSVTLTLDNTYAIGSSHTVTADGVFDLSGNVIDPNPCTLPFRAPVISCGFLYFESFKNIGGADLGSLTANPAYPNSPSEVGYIGGFNSRFFYPSDSLENYGARMRGLFIPPTSGNYIFYIRSDDASRLLLNPAGADPAGAIVLTEELGCCGNFSDHASAPIPLTFGTMYYIEGLYKEGGGGDYMQAAVKLDTDPTPPDQLQPISGNYLATLADPVGASVSVSNPADQLNVLDPQNLSLSNSTFSVVATGGSVANPNTGIYYQWKRDGVPIPGANGSSYTITPKLSDNGAKFSVCVYVPGATAASSQAMLTVAQPNTPPRVACSTNGLPSIMEDAGAQCVPGVLNILSPHSISRATINYGGNFNSGLPPGSAIGGNAALVGGVLHLTDAINGQQSSFVTPSLAAPIDTLTVDFIARVGEGTCCGVARYADGWSLTIGNVSVPVTFPQAAEEGAAASGGFIVSFDNWDNGGFGDDDAHTAPNVDVKVGGSVIAYQAFDGEREGGRAPSGPFIIDPATLAPMTAFTAGTFVPVHVALTADGKLNVDFKGVRVINDVATGVALPLTNTRLAFGARTGGANENMWIDDLSIVAFTVDNSAAELSQTVHVNVTTDHPEYFSVQPSIDANGTLCYTPAPNACGTAHVTAVAMDNGGTAYGGSDSAPACQFDIVIGCVNDCPVAGNQSVTTDEDTALAFVLAASDADGDVLSYGVGSPSHGTLSGTAPSLTYTPAANYCGPDSFSYTVSDGQCTNSGLVSITVRCINDCPIARIVLNPLCVTTGLNTMLILANQNDKGCVILDGRTSSDVEGSPLTYSWFADSVVLPFSIKALTTNCFSIGEHDITLVVDDGGCLGMAMIHFEVVTGCDLVENLIADINNSTLPRNKKRPLIDNLKKICKIFEKDKKNEFKYAVKKLEAFQKKLKGELKNYPVQQAQFNASAQAIIDAIKCAVDLQKKKHLDDDDDD